MEVVRDPEAGAVIRGTGGIRKIRWAPKGRGKSGGTRVIYYWYRPGETILMLLAYSKNRQQELTSGQRRTLRHVVEEELK